MRPTILGLALLALSACGSTSDEAPPPASPPPQPPPVSRAPASAADTCGARAVQQLIGRPRSEIPVPVDPGRQRVACTTCPVTMDFNDARLNFFFDGQTGIIKEIRCG